ncbi:uncharacterized protein CIMG_13768 [Coccidioides immitis RS]|uniref:Uncharacterized protein n=1 Tax=Coccidioides immitis (strain RS) TaxID=246410 RepID=J3KCT4_COCIM|nr:uncharacterized protein CIMG_13768 [Coccidioides immitis RS]EAS33085.3 hypothetical protein CIMG_13768 [Coccidioides immitis RS]
MVAWFWTSRARTDDFPHKCKSSPKNIRPSKRSDDCKKPGSQPYDAFPVRRDRREVRRDQSRKERPRSHQISMHSRNEWDQNPLVHGNTPGFCYEPQTPKLTFAAIELGNISALLVCYPFVCLGCLKRL